MSTVRPFPVRTRRLFAGSGRQGTRRRTGPDRPHRVRERDEKQFRIECFGQVLFRSFRIFHTDLQVAATLYSLIETAKLHGINPAVYLLEASRAADRGEVLLPWQTPR